MFVIILVKNDADYIEIDTVEKYSFKSQIIQFIFQLRQNVFNKYTISRIF